MRIVVFFFFFALSLHPAPGSRNLCPGAIIFDRLFRRNPRVAASAFSCSHPLHPLLHRAHETPGQARSLLEQHSTYTASHSRRVSQVFELA